MNTSASQPVVIPLWPESASGMQDWAQSEQETILPWTKHKLVRNVTHPTLTAYLPDPSVANGTAVIICPGGGFYFYSIENEGTDVAQWLTTQGVAAFVLKYRLIPTPVRDEDLLHLIPYVVLRSGFPLEKAKAEQVAEQKKAHAPLAIMDGKQALRVVRERAASFGIDPQRLGLLGFSAGGIIAVSTATESHEGESRPNFVASIYSPFWLDLVVPADAPPLFIALANDDLNISDGNMPLYAAWKAADRPVVLHI